MNNRLDRIAGSLYGLLIGDALGCPVETWTPGDIARRYGRLTEMVEPMGHWRPRGLHSDDGQQALALCDALLIAPEAPELAFATILVDLFRAGPGRRCGLHRGTGTNFRATVNALAAGAAPHDAGQPSAGNGVAMMIAPAAYWWHHDLDQMRDVVIRVGRVKQKNECGIASAGAVAYLVAHGLERGSFSDLNDAALLAFTRSVEADVSAHLGLVPGGVFSMALARMLAARRGPREDVLQGIVTEAQRSTKYPMAPAAGYSVASVITSIYIVLASDSFEAAVTDVLNLGGDTDTTGAMVGGMAGAAFGRRVLPERWYQALIARDSLEPRIEALARRGVAEQGGATTIRPLCAMEAEWGALQDRDLGPT